MLVFSIESEFYLIVTYILMGLFGLCIGSFLNVVIYRVPLGMSIATPPSHCPKCGYQLKWYDNIPVLSYIILHGKCRKCKEHISFRYTLVELANMFLYLLATYLFNNNIIYMLIAAIVSSISLCITFIDLEHMIIPDRFQVILLVLGILTIFCDSHYNYIDHLIGLGVGAVFFIGIGFIMKLILKREALGGGDVKLAIVSGLMLGWQRFIVMILISSIIACVVFIILAIRDKKKAQVGNEEETQSKEYPFGPFLSFGLVISFMIGYEIIYFYLHTILNI